MSLSEGQGPRRSAVLSLSQGRNPSIYRLGLDLTDENQGD